MHFTKQIINNPEIRLNLTISKLKTILLVCLISFTSLLVRQTLQIQHSCNPMIHWSGELPSECKVAVENDFDSFDMFSSTTKQELKALRQPQITQKTEVYGPPNISSEPLKLNTSAKVAHQNSDLVEVGGGVAAGTAVAAVAIGVFSVTPPGAVLLGLSVAIGVWQAIKKVF